MQSPSESPSETVKSIPGEFLRGTSKSQFMQSSTDEKLLHHTIVLLGIGHTNAHVLDQWRKNPIPNASLICISNFPTATYQGMLPAVLAGQKPISAMEIDLVKLCAAANAPLLIDDVVSLDREKRELKLANHQPILFDVLSIGIGSIPETDEINTELNHIVKIKPMQTFLQRLQEAFNRQVCKTDSPLRVVLIGGGAAGVEICCCLPGFIDTQNIKTPYRLCLATRKHSIRCNKFGLEARARLRTTN